MSKCWLKILALPILHLMSYSRMFQRHSYGTSMISPRLSNSDGIRLQYSSSSSYLQSLESGTWVKFISGASNQDVPLVRNLCYIYTIAGVDCIDLSADEAVIAAANDGIDAALSFLGSSTSSSTSKRPLLMISVNDDEDPHFRKASFNPALCPPYCPRPCEKVCPAWAIPPVISSSTTSTSITATNVPSTTFTDGVISDRCYGCGRCIPICPLGLIEAQSYQVDKSTINSFFSGSDHTTEHHQQQQHHRIQAIEIHTLANHEIAFAALWNDIGEAVLTQAKVLAVSFPDMGNNTIPYLETLQHIMVSHPAWNKFQGVQIWQADGRPMSGDIGKGTAHKSSNLATYVLSELQMKKTMSATSSAVDRGSASPSFGDDGGDGIVLPNTQSQSHGLIDPASHKHFVQLAGGTNNYSGG